MTEIDTRDDNIETVNDDAKRRIKIMTVGLVLGLIYMVLIRGISFGSEPTAVGESYGVAVETRHVTLLGVAMEGSEFVKQMVSEEDPSVTWSVELAETAVARELGCPQFVFPPLEFGLVMRGGSAGAAFVIDRAAQILGEPDMRVAATGVLDPNGTLRHVGGIEYKVAAAEWTRTSDELEAVELVLIPEGQLAEVSVVGDVDVEIREVRDAGDVIAAVWGDDLEREICR